MGQGDDAAYISYSTAKHDKILVEPTLNYAQKIGKNDISAVAGYSYDFFHEEYRGETKLDPLVIGDKYITSFNSANDLADNRHRAVSSNHDRLRLFFLAESECQHD